MKWKGYSHVHNTDELYSFLKNYKGFKRVENYINKVWIVDQRFQGKDAEWQPTREEIEQYQIDKERIKEMHESYKVVERILNEKEERNEDGNIVTQFFCKWTSELLQLPDATTALNVQICNTMNVPGSVSLMR